MKNIVIILSVLAIYGCRTPQLTEEPRDPQPSTIKAEGAVVFKQAYLPNIQVGDPVSFLNGKEIVLSGKFNSLMYIMKDGDVIAVDSIQVITKTVPAFTRGIIKSMKKASNGQIQEINIAFSEEDMSYLYNFQLKGDGSFTLNANAKIHFEGKEYKALAATKGGECLLMFNFSFQTKEKEETDEAGGVEISGEKRIKQK